MNIWKELRTRWMYWRYRNITRTRQRLQLKWAARRSKNPVYMAPSGRGIRPVRSRMAAGVGRTWVILVVVALALGTVHQYAATNNWGPDVVFLGSFGILAVGYLVWWKTG